MAQKAHRGRLPPGASREGPARAPGRCPWRPRTGSLRTRMERRPGEGASLFPKPRDRVWGVARKPGRARVPGSRRGAAHHVPAALAGGRLSRAGGSRGLRRARWRRGRAGRGAHVVPPVLPSGPRRLRTRAYSPERWLAPRNASPRRKAARGAETPGGSRGQERGVAARRGARTGFTRTSSRGRGAFLCAAARSLARRPPGGWLPLRTWRAARSGVFTFCGRSTLCCCPFLPLAGSSAAASLLPEGRVLRLPLPVSLRRLGGPPRTPPRPGPDRVVSPNMPNRTAA